MNGRATHADEEAGGCLKCGCPPEIMRAWGGYDKHPCGPCDCGCGATAWWMKPWKGLICPSCVRYRRGGAV